MGMEIKEIDLLYTKEYEDRLQSMFKTGKPNSRIEEAYIARLRPVTEGNVIPSLPFIDSVYHKRFNPKDAMILMLIMMIMMKMMVEVAVVVETCH